ncbi:MAG: polysaccharide biosynthesis protein [Desulfurococcaceae archaeon]
MEKKQLLLTVAGYGGHSGYAYAVLYELAKLGFRDNIIVIAKEYDFLVEKFRSFGLVKTLTLPRRPGEPLYRGVHRWIKSLFESTNLISRFHIGSVFATGSNLSITPSILAKLIRGASVFTMEAIEHFKKPSRSIKIIEKTGGVVLLHWDEQLEMYPKGIVVGPVYEPPIYEPRDEGYILVTTGTLGYKELFDAISEINPSKVVLQTGDISPNHYIGRHPDWVVFKYTSDIHRWLAGASIVITQQGVTAATARLGYDKPVIIVYNPRVTLGAPRRDIELYAEKLNAIFLDKPDPKALRSAVESMGKPSKKYPQGSRRVAEMLIEHLKHH